MCQPVGKAQTLVTRAVGSPITLASAGPGTWGGRSWGRWDALVYNAVHGEDLAERAHPEGMGQSLSDLDPHDRSGAGGMGGSGARRWAIPVGLDHPALQRRARDRAGGEVGGDRGGRNGSESAYQCQVGHPSRVPVWATTGQQTPARVKNWWREADLNCRPRAYETPALPLSYPAMTVQETIRSPRGSQGTARANAQARADAGGALGHAP